MRLQKYLAGAGVASRRKCEELIAAGRVSINGETASIGQSVEPGDEVELDGKKITGEQERVILAFYKPRGVVSTAFDPEGRPTVSDYFKGKTRLFNVGRLDFDSEGLLLMTNDGELAYKLTHPKFTVEKTYYVRCNGILAPADAKKLEEGVLLEDGMTAPATISGMGRNNGDSCFFLTIHEGKNRQIRRMLAAVGHRTLVLRRVAEGPVRLGGLQPGESRALTKEEEEALRKISFDE